VNLNKPITIRDHPCPFFAFALPLNPLKGRTSQYISPFLHSDEEIIYRRIDLEGDDPGYDTRTGREAQ